MYQSKLQTQCSLSTTESEYISLYQALREIIPIINLLEKLTFNNIDTVSSTPIVFCKAFEDNLGALELENHQKRNHVQNILISRTIVLGNRYAYVRYNYFQFLQKIN